MSLYSYIAVTAAGKTKKGVLEGDSISHIRETLQQRGLIPIEINATAKSNVESTSKFKLLKGRRSVSVTHLAIMTYQFSTLLSAGLSVESALHNIATELDNHNFREVLLNVRSRVLEGHTLAYGMREYPQVFPKLYVASVNVGEKTGQLDHVLVRLADYYEKQRAVSEKIFSAMVYPAFLTLFAGAVIIFLLTHVIPQVTTVFIQSGQSLPTLTRVLLAVSDSLMAYGLYTLILIVGLIVTFKLAMRNIALKEKYHRFLLSIPVLNKTIIAVNAARFLRTFGILFAAGVPVIDAMTSANSIIGLLPMHRAIAVATTQVGEGKSIHTTLQHTGYFSSLSNQLIASGEASGQLEAMLEKAASFQEQQTSQKLSTALALFEPILILSMGLIVLFIVLAVLIPIFDMNQLVQ